MTTFVRLPRAPRRSVNRVKAPSILGAATAGVPATYVMDLAGREIVAPVLGKGPSGNLGRWIGHMLKGRFTHEDITKAAPVPHEAAIGTAAQMFPARGQGIMGLRDRDVRVPAFALATHVA
ncbi:MAG TPA: DUF2938 family protein [Gaiellaceae bacterium]